MIKFEKTEVMEGQQAIRGMRNPMNSWEKSDSGICKGGKIMKRRISMLLCFLMLIVALTACGGISTTEKKYNPERTDLQSMFVELEESINWKVVYHKQTKVMYVVSSGGYNHGTFTLMVDPDGNPLLYEEDVE